MRPWNSHDRGPTAELRSWQASYAGVPAGPAGRPSAYVAVRASHLGLRFASDVERQLETLANLRDSQGRWSSSGRSQPPAEPDPSRGLG